MLAPPPQDFIRKDGGACAGYIDRLAAQLAMISANRQSVLTLFCLSVLRLPWHRLRGLLLRPGPKCTSGGQISDAFLKAWADVLYLAFLYLDIDCDGFLSADDLTGHIPGWKSPRHI